LNRLKKDRNHPFSVYLDRYPDDVMLPEIIREVPQRHFGHLYFSLPRILTPFVFATANACTPTPEPMEEKQAPSFGLKKDNPVVPEFGILTV
jgi:hypothetical protein